MAHKLTVDFDTKVENGLIEGFGIEDIAVDLGCDPAAVRRSVVRMRRDGTLKKTMDLRAARMRADWGWT